MNKTFTSSDFIIDCLEDFWGTYQYEFPNVKKHLLNFDNGGENSSHRTQFMKRIVDFVESEKMEIELAYYQPYHSKYNPIERVWGALALGYYYYDIQYAVVIYMLFPLHAVLFE